MSEQHMSDSNANDEQRDDENDGAPWRHVSLSEAVDAERDEGDEHGDDAEHPLARVRYGLGKELLLFDDAISVVSREEATELHFALASIRRLILAPGDPTPSKLVLMFDLEDGETVIAAEGMTNVRDFRKLLERLQDIRPEIELDPPDMDAQLAQALEIRRRSNLGCYGVALGSCLLLWLIYLTVAFIGLHGRIIP